MESVHCYVIKEVIYIQCPDDEVMESITNNFHTRHFRRNIYKLVGDPNIRKFLEDRSVPYAVFVGDFDCKASRSWKPSTEKPIDSISGVGGNKADILRSNGFVTVDDIKSESQAELAEVEGIGNALAARIKADVGSINLV